MSAPLRISWGNAFAKAKARGETVNAFCRRVGCTAQTAKRHARACGHTFAPLDKTQRWRLRFEEAAAHGETLTRFCIRCGTTDKTALAWAKRLGHTFAPSQRTKRRVQQWAAAFQAAQR